jgi:rhamnulokinase
LAGPVISERALALNLSNEHGVGGTTRFLKNVMGLWLLQECRRAWARSDGYVSDYHVLVDMATSVEPGRFLIDPDDSLFQRASDMPAAIQSFSNRHSGTLPESRAEIVRCIIDSLALRYRWVLEALTACVDNEIIRINVVGGGSQNRLLCQTTADVTGLPVEAGPVEAAVLGNLIVQGVATGSLSDLREGRELIRTSFSPNTLEPRESARWDEIYPRFCQLVDRFWS